MKLTQKLFLFKGRINRKIYWLCSIFINIIFSIIYGVLTSISPELGMYSIIILIPIMIWISIVLGVKRLKDLDKNPWMILLWLIPIANLYIFIISGFFKGTTGPNKYGPDPLNPGMKKEETVQL